MRGVAIVSPVRTAVGNFGGNIRDISAAELGSIVIKEVLERTGLNPEKVDDVILGHGYPSGENPAMGRLASLKAGLPIEVPGYQLDRRCSSGLQAVLNASMLIQTENADVVIAGGVESMSNAEFYVNESRWGARFGSVTLHDRLARSRETISPEERFGYISGMIETAENLAKQYEISRKSRTNIHCAATSGPLPPWRQESSASRLWRYPFRNAGATRKTGLQMKVPGQTLHWRHWPGCAP